MDNAFNTLAMPVVDSFVSQDVVLLNESHRSSSHHSDLNKKLNAMRGVKNDRASTLIIGKW